MKDSSEKIVVALVLALLSVIFITVNVFAAEDVAMDGRFVAYNNGTVLDRQTNLMWAAKDNGYNITRHGAEEYCQYYRGGGYSNWRLPTQDELAGLYDETKSYKTDCNFDAHLTELIRLSSPDAWAVETKGSKAAYFSFVVGAPFWYDTSLINLFRALPVRSLR